MSKYKNIKLILKKQIDKGVIALWTFDDIRKEFTQIYKNYNSELTIYTPKQLLDKISQMDEIEHSNEKI
tara:strand:- start:2007 stop:2213 length:207 start_codon:yes stop_codon:yes gene_type:complete